MAGNEIGNVKSVSGTSMALNTQRGESAQKPNPKGNASPGGTKPDKPECGQAKIAK